MNEIALRYGMNPHQKPARAYVETGEMPFKVLNGSPGFINLLDLLNASALVKELDGATGLPAAASFKHVSPAGAAVGVAMSKEVAKASFADDLEPSPLATAYARARGADRMSSFGDAVALSRPCDLATARFIRREVSDCVIAPGYEPGVVDVLKKKSGGRYLVVEADPSYEPPEMETRVVQGVTMEQPRNAYRITDKLLSNVVTKRKDLPESARRDLLVATVALKYTQSNSVCFALGGQVIGLGAGQQSRLHCTRLAGSKADMWWLRQHPMILGLKFKKGVGRAVMNNAIEAILTETRQDPFAADAWKETFEERPPTLARDEKRSWIEGLKGVSLSSDAFFPFRDSIDRAAESGVEYVLQPGGSVRDKGVIEACDEYGMVMACSGVRLFHH
ncbi:MAG: phosphoribosylaminoimidazolecarboxamide formyltransferase [Planctomycetes bacterium]|nr:phosphoribosylaminoimidazolecarboxamide formyltransferase [Planctomycetota bacterium]